jgi:hypothetical protein
MLVLVALCAFGLGRLSVIDEAGVAEKESVRFVMTDLSAAPPPFLDNALNETESTATPNALVLVASRSGTRYHLPSCPGAKRIKAENRIYFQSRAEAEAAGYTPAANCKGLW